MALNGGRVPPELVMPTVRSIEELDAYVEAYGAMGREAVGAVALRRAELQRSAGKSKGKRKK